MALNMPITRLRLHQIMVDFPLETVKKRKSRVIDFLKEQFQTIDNEDATKTLTEFIRNSFFAPYFTNWRSVSRKNNKFLIKYHQWLQKEIVFPEVVVRCLENNLSSSGDSSLDTSRTGGRPSKSFEDCSIIVKRRRTEDIRSKNTCEELSFATAMKLRETGNIDAAKLVTEATTTSPGRAKKILKSWQSTKPQISSYSVEEALALIISLNLTRDQYQTLRNGALAHEHNLYPPYYKILDLKKEFYPKNILITEQKCEVSLQNLLTQTCHSIVKSIPSEISHNENRCLTLISKWGFDGSSGYSSYKQIRQDFTPPRADESLFTTSLVPLRLIDQQSKEVIWKNPQPSSKRYCRPIRLQWLHETDEISRQEQNFICDQIRNLTPVHSLAGKIDFSLCLTMVDGKVCSALSKTSSMTCPICKATISKMNDIASARSRPIETESLQFGLSVLHAYIRCFECLLHIAYRLELKVWKVTKEKKEAFGRKKRKIQTEFKNKMGLSVDIPKSGFGTTNDGNMARRFFANPTLSSEITGIDEELIRRFGVILRTINSGYDINLANFEQYCLKTAELYVCLYNWYYMPISVHKLLIHGPITVKNALLPIGELSEEAQEAKNKDIRKYRQGHTRKISGTKVNEDLFHRLILSSDPYLSGFNCSKAKFKTIDDPDMRSLIVIIDEVEKLREGETKEDKAIETMDEDEEEI